MQASHSRGWRGAAATATLLAATAACNTADTTSTRAPSTDPITVQATTQGVTASNSSVETIFYHAQAVATDTAAWTPCVAVSSCPFIGPNATVTVPDSAIAGFRSGVTTEVNFYWWTALPRTNLPDTNGVVHREVVAVP